MHEEGKTLKYTMCRSCREALRLGQTVEYIHPSVLIAMQTEEPIRLDPVRNN